MLQKAGEMQPKRREAEKKMNEKLEGRGCRAWTTESDWQAPARTKQVFMTGILQ